MSEEEAIHVLKKERYDIEPICSEGKIFITALDMAIKALECQKSSKEQANTQKSKETKQMETYIRLRCNQPPDIVEIDPKHLLESIRKALDCDTIEITPFAGGLMILDDCGKLTGKPYNPVASLVYQSKRDWIAGDVLLAGSGLRDGEQDIVPLGKNLQEVNLAVANKIWNHIMLEQERMK